MNYRALKVYACGFPIFLALLVCSVSCATVQYWDDEDGPNPKPTPLPSDRWTPFPRDIWTPLPRGTPHQWDKVTFSSDMYTQDSGVDGPTMAAIIFVVMFLVVVFIMICKYACKEGACGENDGGDNYTSSRTLHPPPRNAFPAFATPSGLPTSGDPVRLSATTAAPSAPQLPARNVPSRSWKPSSEMPPDYSAVVLGDFSQSENFPEVRHQAKCDSPPSYGVDITQKY